MTALYSSVAGSIVRPVFNVLVNSSAAYGVSRLINAPDCRDIAIIVAIDTAFRIGIIHVLSARNIHFHQNDLVGHLLFPCLTLLTQPLSVKIARIFNVNARWQTRPYFITTFGYIALGWKMNMMVKDILYIFAPSLKRA